MSITLLNKGNNKITEQSSKGRLGTGISKEMVG